MIYPKKLEKGDTIGIIATSSPIPAEREALCVEVLEKMGYKVKKADNLSTNYGGYMAGTGKVRGEWVNKMFADPEVDAIFCVRGGDSSSRAMEHIDLDIVRANPKIFVGYSDVTAPHLAFNQDCGLVTFHGPMVSSNMVDQFDEETARSFFEIVNGEGDINYWNPAGKPIEVMKEGKASGTLVGGNLSLMTASIGTPYEVDTTGKILFIEEVGDSLDNMERHAFQMRAAGKYQKAAGFFLGQFTRCGNPKMPEYDYLECFKDIFDNLDIPVMYNIQSGHEFPMTTLPLGAECTIDTADRSIVFHMKREMVKL